MRAENQEILERIFRIVLEIPNDEDVHQARQINHPRWDSLAHLSLIAAIDSELGVTLSDISDAEQITSFASATILLGEMGL